MTKERTRYEARKLSAMARLSLVSFVLFQAVPARPAPNDISLLDGKGYPVCRAVVVALRKMPPGTDKFGWVEHLPAIRGVTRPRWTPLAAVPSRPSEAGTPSGKTSANDEERAEETTIPGVVIKVVPAMGYNGSVTEDLHLVRRASRENNVFHISNIRTPSDVGQTTTWRYDAVGLSIFFETHHVTIESHYSVDLILVGGRPWFVSYPGVMGTLIASGPQGGRPGSGLIIEQRCFIGFPWR